MPVRVVLGLALIVAGVLIVLSRLDVLNFDWDDLWPLILIFIGVSIILKGIQLRSAVQITDEEKEMKQ